MKFGIKLGEINIERIILKNIEIEAVYSADEVKENYKLIKTAIKDIPEILEDVKKGFDKFNEIDEEVNNEIKETIKNGLLNRVKTQEPSSIDDL